jgi:hypothetical protein
VTSGADPGDITSIRVTLHAGDGNSGVYKTLKGGGTWKAATLGDRSLGFREARAKRKKKPSKKFRDAFGHTPLSVEEEIP